jgi:pantothenate kinase type III
LPDKLGTTTLTALALGIDRGAVGMTRELMRVAEKQYGVQKFYAAGGDADFFCKAIDELVDAEKLFTLRGVGVIACKHAE